MIYDSFYDELSLLEDYLLTEPKSHDFYRTGASKLIKDRKALSGRRARGARRGGVGAVRAVAAAPRRLPAGVPPLLRLGG